MKRRRQLWMLILATSGLLVVVAAGLGVAVKHEPAFYQRAAIPAGPHRDELTVNFHRSWESFLNLVNNGGGWTWTFNQDELNAHLQDDEPGSAKLFSFPETVSDPRVEFGDERVRVGFRYGTGWSSAIVVVDLKAWLVAREPNVIAVELCGLSVGGIPLGTHALMEFVTEAARDQNADVTWYRTGGHPVALLRLQANQNRPTLQ